MRILIVSDTHGHSGNLRRALEEAGSIDLMIHCGDVEGEEDYIEELAQVPCYMVSGNNDFFSSLPREQELEIKGYRFLVTHGHSYGVSLNLDGIMEEARSRGFDVVCFGHTHRPVICQADGVTAVNPGSLSYPRQERREPSYVILEDDDQGELKFTVHFLEKTDRNFF